MLCVYIYYIYIMWERCITHSHDLYGTKQERFFLAIRNASLGLAGLADGSLSTFRRKYFDPHGCICIYYIYIYMYNIRGSRQCNAVNAMYLWVFPKVGVPWNHPKFDYFNIEIHEFRAFPGENTYPWFDDLWSEKADDFASPFREYFQWARFEWFFQDAALQVKLWNWFEKNPSSVPPFQHWRLWVGGETRTMISLGVHKSHETLHRWSENVGYPIGFP